MDRRTFMSMTGAAGMATLAASDSAAQEKNVRDYYELRTYTIDTQAQKDGFNAFMKDAAIPALNRLGITQVGVFEPSEEDLGPIYVLLKHPSAESFATLTRNLIADETFGAAGAAFLDAPSTNPAYARMESSLLLAFEGMPQLERPTEVPGRVFQLRIYESPSVQTGQKKIEMFNVGEIDIFRKTGLHPVFFGEALAGEKMPNLTYMLSFDSMEEQQANWKTFVNSPEWKEISAKPEYANDRILCGITNINLKPMACSQL